MATKYKPSNENCHASFNSDTKETVSAKKSAPCPGFKASISGFINSVINSKSYFAFSGNKDTRSTKSKPCDDKLRETRETSSNSMNYVTSLNVKNGGSEREIGTKMADINEIPSNSDGSSVASIKSAGTTGTVYFLSSSGGENGDILKPLGDDIGKSFENKKKLFSRLNIPVGLDDDQSDISCSKPGTLNLSACTEDSQMDSNSENYFTTLMSNCQGDHNFPKIRNEVQSGPCNENIRPTSFGEPGLNHSNLASDINKSNSCIQQLIGTGTSNNDAGLDNKSGSETFTGANNSHVGLYSPVTNYGIISSLGELKCESNYDESSSTSSTSGDEDFYTTCDDKTDKTLFYETNLNCDTDKSSVKSDVSQSLDSENVTGAGTLFHESELNCDIDCKSIPVSDSLTVVSDSSSKETSQNNNVKCAIKGIENYRPILTSNETSCNKLIPSISISTETVPSLVSVQENIAHTEEKEMLDIYITEIKRKLAGKELLYEANRTVAISRPDDSFFMKLDSSVKKNTAFVRKVKNFTTNQLETLLKDVSSLNMTKYLGEVASAIVQAKLKICDILPAVEFCNAIHHIYVEFSSHLFHHFQRHLLLKDDQIINYRKVNVDLKFCMEIMKVGILSHEEAFPLITNVITFAMNMDKEAHENVNIILNFYCYCKEGYTCPQKMRNIAQKYKIELPKSSILLENETLALKIPLRNYYASFVEHAKKVHHEVQMFDHQNKKILQSRGELSAERKERWESLKLLNERLLLGLENLSQELDEEMPLFVVNDDEENSLSVVDNNCEEQELLPTLWEDEEEQRFYEFVPDIREFASSLPSNVQSPAKANITVDRLNTEDEESEEELLPEDKTDDLNDADEIDDVSNVNNKICEIDRFLSILQNCTDCNTVDTLAVDFVMNLNNKHNRKKLVKTLTNVPRTKSNLLPFYARLVAVLCPVIPAIGSELCQLLTRQLKFHVRKKNQFNIESKLKVVQFIGELVKFKIYSRPEALFCLKLLLHDFSHHNIEMCCTFLETCGRYLFRYSDSHRRTKIYLEQMMRKKTVTALESRYVTMIETAFYYVDPPDPTPSEKKDQPPLHHFIEKLLYQELRRSNTEEILELLSKVDWENTELAEFSIKSLTMAHRVKYNNIGYLASIVSGLTCEKEEESVSILVVDGVLEDIRLGMEVNLPKYNQRRLAMMKYLGELYNYRMVKSSDIFEVLYSLISFGVTLDYSNPSHLDPPDHLFRIRLCCILLETCGQYFNSASSVKRLDYYLTYFQRYFWFKYEDKYWNMIENPFPVGMQYLFQDTLLNLRPEICLFTSFHEAEQAVYQIQVNLATVLPDSTGSTPWLRRFSDDGLQSQKSDLGTITEEDDNQNVNLVDKEREYIVEKVMKSVQNHEPGGEPTYHYAKRIEYATNPSKAQHIPHKGTYDFIPYSENVDEADFISEFDKMVSENIQDHKKEIIKPQNIEIPVPKYLKNNKKTYENHKQNKIEDKSAVSFILLMKKGHKQHYKWLKMPVDCELALKLKTSEEAERAEKNFMKRLTLDMNERLQEESYQETLAQTRKSVLMKFSYNRKNDNLHSKTLRSWV